ncbi:serine/threonine-protein kinase RIO3-like [Diabrotica virgifera virgifera]|uniref:Serine/threonine-protein kinase RIO3 n=1 Tax=Diabrotica virgifera virgifera TaxID=50390 RepID=A0A6P7G9L8_DIAVI|nr:serine/threonine-protein kinase RIO3-like [Diabrotica virgifera virgifera]
MTSPWAKIQQPHPVNLEEILSEELARQLQIKEDKKLSQKNNEGFKTVFDNISDSGEAMVEEFNRSSTLLDDCGEDDFISNSDNEEEILDAKERKFWDRFENLEPELDLNPQCPNKNKGHILTEDYQVMSEIQRVCRLKVYPHKCFSETIECCQEKFTYTILYKMIEKQLLKSIHGIIGEGREAIILHANSDPSSFLDVNLPKECAIKVYKTILSDFKGCEKFGELDHRFMNRKGRQASTSIISICAEKEMTNLMLMQEAGIPCPKVVTLRKHVLVMEFIGKNQIPAPTLKDVRRLDIDWKNAYEQVIVYMKILFNKLNLVHADLSEDNILWYEGQCYLIDVSECVEKSHEKALLCLYRDCTNITDFFSKKDVPNVATPNGLFSYITGFDFNDRVALPDKKESLKFKRKPHPIQKPPIELEYNVVKQRKRKNSETPNRTRIQCS